MNNGCSSYWTIALHPKSTYLTIAERWVFFWPLSDGFTPRFTCLGFHRLYVFFAVFFVQFCTGSIYALLSLANPINVFFHFEAHSTNATNLLLEAGIISSAAQALIGPFLERKGPRTSLAWSTLLLAIGLLLAQLACTTSSWILLHIGFDIMGIALGAILLCSISTALKWCPDLRGTVTGICLVGYGVGVGLWRMAFHALLDESDRALSYLFGLLFVTLIPILIIATLILRTPPSDFSVNGYDMHCIPSNKAPNANIVQDDYLRVGMTLINYRAIGRTNSDAIEGTDRHYHEQVKALTLAQCILSTDFLCLYIAFAANGLVGLLYGKLTATQLSHDLLVDWYGISSAYADTVRFRGILADLAGRIVFPVISDLCIRLLYANPAAVRKGCFSLILLAQCIALPIVYFHSNNMSNFTQVEWLLYVIQFTCNGGAALIVCFLTDMYGVYHVGTMYGIISTSWTIDQALLTLTAFESKTDFSDQVALFWYISIGGLLLMWFVRTNTFDRFYCGYQLTICSKVLIKRPNKDLIDNNKADCDLLRGEEGSYYSGRLSLCFVVACDDISSLSLVKMSRAIRKYWTIALASKSPYANEAERYLFYWPFHSLYEYTPRWRCIKFRRFYIFLAVFLIQFCAGSLYAFITLANPINVYFKLDDSSRQADLLFFIAGVLGILSQALLGPLLERSGPQKSMIRGTVGLTLGLALAQIAMSTSCWILLHIGIDIVGIAFGSIVITSISTAQKWCPDLRGTIAGVCLFGYGFGTGLWSSIFHAMIDNSHEALQRVFGLLMIILVPVLTITGLVLRTPPNNFSVHGYDMHCIPSERAPNVDMVQDEYLKVGQTLVNYKAIMSAHSDSMNEGTDREYHEQVKSLTLSDCILSIDFLCLFIAFAANGLVGLVYTELTAVKVSKDFLVDWFQITSYQASRVRLYGTIADLAGRLVIPVFSDVCIRVFYGNPAVVRKVCFIILLLIQSIALPIFYFNSDNLSNFTCIQWLLYIVQFCSNGGATLIVCFLTDMYGVYHVGTMYGLLSTSWGIDQIIVSFTDNNSKIGFSSQVALFWYISMAGLLLMFFVRTNSFDRFYRGYQLTLCGRVIIRRPGRRHTNPKQALIEELALEENPGSFFLWDSDKSSNIKNVPN